MGAGGDDRTFRMSPLEPRTAGNLKGFGFTVTWGDPINNEGGRDENARPDPEPVIDRRRRHDSESAVHKDVHHELGLAYRPANASAEPVRSNTADAIPVTAIRIPVTAGGTPLEHRGDIS